MNKKLASFTLFIALISLFLLALPNHMLAQTPLFAPQTEYVASGSGAQGPSGIAVADFNGDGKPDLAVVNFADWTAWVLLGNGDGTFQPAQKIYGATGGGLPWYIAVGDFNGDGKPDLVITNYGDNSFSVLLGNGDGTFQPPRTSPLGTHPAQIAVGDFNGDGKLDLAISNVGDNTISMLLGNGDGTFQAPMNIPVGPNPWYFAVGDFNGDGKLDLAVSDYGCPLDCNTSPSNTVTVLLGNGDGTFRSAPNLSVGNGPAGVTVGDFNGDGRQDLAVANVNDNTVSILLGNGDGTFQAPQTFADPALTHPYYIAAADFNGDGKQDLVITNHLHTTVAVLLGNGDGTFQAAQGFAVDNDPVYAAVHDFNGDGKPDLAVANLHAVSISVLLNIGGSLPVVATPTFSPGGGTYTGSVTVSISDATSGATIYYTTDGSTPTTSSTVYTGALTFTQTTTLKAMAAATGMTNSAVASAIYTVQQQQQVATPTFSPGGGTYTGSVTVSISDVTSGATIYYTTDGSTPTTSSAVYTGTLTFTQTTTLKAMAAASGMTNSAVASATYTVQQQVATPTFSPGGGTYTGSVTVSISDATSGATIHYTTDGSTPTTSSAVYSGALTFTQTTTLKAMAAASGMTNSAVASATYTVQQQVATPTFSPGPGTYTGSVTVTISDATSGATIYYTTDGSTPTSSSAVYTGALTFTQTTTLKAMAAASGMTNSAVASATYTVHLQPVATPTFSPGPGTYTGLVTVTISDATSGATIYYTTDGSTPTTSSAVYTAPLTFTQTTTLKAMAGASGMANSPVASAKYTILLNLTVSKTDLGGGTITSSPGGINCGSTCSGLYASGTTVQLTATPGLLSGFGGWTGCDSVSGNTCTVQLNSARSVTADFKLLGLL